MAIFDLHSFSLEQNYNQLRETCTDDWFAEKVISYKALFRDPEDGEIIGFLGKDKENQLHFRNLNGREEGRFWSLDRENFLFSARKNGLQIISNRDTQGKSKNLSKSEFVLPPVIHFPFRKTTNTP